MKKMQLRNPALSGSWQSVANPAGWSWSHGLTIQRKNRSFRAAGFDVSSLLPAATVTYYVSKTGSDGNTGADWDNALRNIYTAVQKADVDRIYIGAGVWSRDDGWQGIDLIRTCGIIGVGTVLITGHDAGLVWVSEGPGLPNTYSTTRSTTQGVYDALYPDANGDYLKYTLKASSAEVDANAGSWYMDGANKLWVRCTDDRAPDDNIWPMLNAFNGDCLGDIHVYFENLVFVGGSHCFRHQSSGAGQTPELYVKNCTFRQGSNGNGLTLLGISKAILQGCLAAGNTGDGLNYHVQNAITPRAIEINCTTRDNGLAGDDDQGSSMHDAGSVVRLNGRSYRNRGGNYVESAAAESWAMGCLSYDSEASIAGARSNFELQGGVGVMWLDRCNSSDSDYDILAGASTTIHTRDFHSEAVNGDR